MQNALFKQTAMLLCTAVLLLSGQRTAKVDGTSAVISGQTAENAYMAEKTGTAAEDTGASAGLSLPDGAVAGLPDGLTVLDEEGNAASGIDGSYYFDVEDMEFGTTYTKAIQLMNLREDKAYHIYFYAEPVSDRGQLYLRSWCTCVITLEGETVYTGRVDGEGETQTLSEQPLDLGLYTPGQGRTMEVSVTWDTWGDPGRLKPYTEIVDADGNSVVYDSGNDGYAYGETTFRWIFFAVADEDYVPPKTGILSERTLWYLLYLLAALACVILACALLYRRRKQAAKAGGGHPQENDDMKERRSSHAKD